MAKIFVVRNDSEMKLLADKMCSGKITKPLKISVCINKESRSLSQNKLMWKWHSELREHIISSTGFISTTDAIHDHIMRKFLDPKITEFNNVISESYSTRKLPMKAFSNFLEKYDMHCVENYNLKLTHPDDLYNEAMGIRNG